jgi:hypothetical protein
MSVSTEDGSHRGGTRALNAIDRSLSAADRGMRARGASGYLLQVHVWFRGQVDEEALRAAVQRLGRAYPVLTARLVRTRGGRASHWRLRPHAACGLDFGRVSGSDEAVRAEAEALFRAPSDPVEHDPVRFRLLRLAGGRDVLLMQWSHVLADGKAGEFILGELDRAWTRSAQGHPLVPLREVDEAQGALGHVPWKRRLRSYFTVLRSGPGRTVSLSSRSVRRFEPLPSRLVVRVLDRERTAAFIARMKRICGFRNPTPGLVASAFRALRRITPQRVHRRSSFCTFVPLGLRAPDTAEPLFCNYQTYVVARARLFQLEDRDGLVRSIHAGMRRQLRNGTDLAVLRGLALLGRRPRLADLAQSHGARSLSLAYGYHGAVVRGLDRLFGTPVERLFNGIPSTASPPGLALAANEFDGRLHLAASFVAEAVPEALAARFLEEVADDLAGPAPGA